jgi:hypothetical protein
MTLCVYASGFRRTGLIPFNPQIVLDTMKEYKAQQHIKEPPNSPRSISSWSESPDMFATLSQLPQPTNWNNWSIPLTMRTYKKGVDYIQSWTVEAMQGTPITPSVVRVQDKIKKASETSMLTGALSTHWLRDLTIAEDVCKSWKDASGKVVQKYGEIYGNQACLQIQADIEDERQVVNIREKRLQKPWQEKYKKIVKKFVQEYKQVRLKDIGLELWSN